MNKKKYYKAEIKAKLGPGFGPSFTGIVSFNSNTGVWYVVDNEGNNLKGQFVFKKLEEIEFPLKREDCCETELVQKQEMEKTNAVENTINLTETKVDTQRSTGNQKLNKLP